MNRFAGYGTAIVLVHLLVSLFHGEAHLNLKVNLGLAGMVFVFVVILAAPLVAMALLWTPRQRLGLFLLAVSMAGSFIFGLYNHFVEFGPDHVGHQSHESWGLTFIISAWLLLLTESAGAVIPLIFLLKSRNVVTR